MKTPIGAGVSRASRRRRARARSFSLAAVTLLLLQGAAHLCGEPSSASLTGDSKPLGGSDLLSPKTHSATVDAAVRKDNRALTFIPSPGSPRAVEWSGHAAQARPALALHGGRDAFLTQALILVRYLDYRETLTAP